MENLVGFCLGTSATFAVAGLALCTWKHSRSTKRLLVASNIRLLEVDPKGARAVYALKGSEVSRVKSLGFKGSVHKKNISSVEALLKQPITISQRTGTVEVRESSEPVFLSKCGEEEIMTDNREALERYVQDYEKNHKEQDTDSLGNAMAICYYGSTFSLYAAAGLACIDMLS
ncbi:hypothetical protein B1750_gp428 [Noumeavirus]|uniref:hypothetical protein n=1 Tax=Noumeavirus TaxID=1955558 RepID=UPI000982BE86|nr:hypothetical protein B1750_gp428 [Noumeavirus]AQM73409.1 hypothetical protein NMV_428 [Noumeavirus]